MPLSYAKRLIQSAAKRLGLQIIRANQRATVVGALRQARAAGLAPNTVIDVGAARGEFTIDCLTVFPDAHYVLIEPLDEYRSGISALVANRPGLEHIQAVAAAEPGEIWLNVHDDLVGSSIYREHEASGVNGQPRMVPAITIDQLVIQRALPGPYLLKVDVQGAELAVLSGATDTLRSADYVLLETSLFNFFEGGHVFHEVISYMHSHGFVAYDVLGQIYRPLDNALAQVDIAFVKENGILRQQQFYATAEQRLALLRRMAANR